MTHTLHRVGNEENLREDFVLLAMPSKDINHEGSGPKLQEIIRICLKAGAVKAGDARLGNEYHQGGLETMIANIEDRAVVTAVFNDPAKLVNALKTIKEADFGMSIVVSGLFDRVKECCHAFGQKVHTVNTSLGRWGATHKLPANDMMEIQSMCGHGMVSVNLIADTVDKVKNGDMSLAEASERLFRPCQCGIFNTDRAQKLIAAMM
ncbi:MAG: hypothetical protein KQI81_02370 [Deltaproteobacteria bacterium]|nr:hypothetical protein [Deltaproteobacteria bacterium]